MTVARTVLPLFATVAFGLGATLSPLPVAAQTSTQVPPANAQEIDPATTVVATVGGEDIYLAQLLGMMDELPAQYRQIPFQQIFPALLERAIDGRLVANAARKSDVGDDPSVQLRIRQAEDDVLSEAWLNQEIGAQVTDDAVRERYDAVAAEQADQEEVRARHILLETEGDARDVIEALSDGGDFAELARERSTGPSSVEGGDLGWFGQGQMVPEFETAAFALEPGAYTEEPVQTQFGWHVILLEDKRSAGAPPFEQMQDQIASELTRDLIAQTLEQLRDGAEILRFNPDGTVPSVTPQPE